MRFVGRGHPAVRATHTKTLELAAEPELTERGTCIIAVDATAQPATPMAGPVRIRITAGGHHATVHANANSSWDPSGPIVVRRGPLRLPGTFATDADTSAADLPRELVAALQDADALVTVDVVAVPSVTVTTVLFCADPSRPDDPRLLAEWDAADTVERQDAGARALVAAKRGEGTRRLIVATSGLPYADPDAGETEVVGLPTQLAVAAASGGNIPVAIVASDRLRESLRRLPASTRIATETVPTDLPSVLALAHEIRGISRCVVAQPFGPMQRADAEHPPPLYGRDPVFVCFDAGADGDLDPDVRAAVTGLLADGVPSKTAAAALATLTGLTRRAAYETVLGLRAT